MIQKKLIHPGRVRRIPPQFSWIDHRLVRDRHITGPSPEALALYLLLVTVGDAEGLSYYADPTVAKLLALEMGAVAAARHELLEASLIAYERPFYQVLSLSRPVEQGLEPKPRAQRAQRIGELIPGILEELL